MDYSKRFCWLLILLCLTCGTPILAQQAAPLPTAASRPLLTSADTLEALHALFQMKRKTSGLSLAAAPVALGLTVVTAAVAALSQLDSGSSDATLPTIGMLAGIGGTVGLLSHYVRYTKGSEAEVLSLYERTHELPSWVKRNLAQQRLGKP